LGEKGFDNIFQAIVVHLACMRCQLAW